MEYKRYIKKINMLSGGFSLIEVMFIVLLISIALIGLMRGFFGLEEGFLKSRSRSASVNIAQEEVEALKKKDYARLYVTTQDDLDDYGYDNTYYPPVTYIEGGKDYTTYVTIKKVREAGGDLIDLSPGDADEGLKRIQVDVDWTEGETTKTMTIYNVRENPDRVPLSGGISGVVRDKDAPATKLTGAKIYVVENPNWIVTADDDGEFEISVSTGLWHLNVSFTGYYERVNGSYTVTEGDTYEVPPGQLDLEKRTFGSIRGLVISTDGVVIRGATVTCNDDTSSSYVSKSTTATGDDNWNYEIVNATTGTWTVSASSGAPLSLYGSTSSITVQASLTTNDVDIVLSTPTTYGTISGVADMSDTGDDSGMKVSAGGSWDMTDSEGNYTIENIDAGYVTVTANPGPFNSSYTTDTTTATVLAGQDVDADKITIYPAGSVSGTVYTAGGVDPFPGIVIRAVDDNTIERGVDLSDSDGTYQIIQLPDDMGGPDLLYTISPILDSEDTSDPTSIDMVDIEKGVDIANSTFTITPAWGYIKGEVDDNGKPITTGVIIFIATATISDPPPDITVGESGKYGGISYSEGIYNIKVRTDFVYKVYGWYTDFTGSGTDTDRKGPFNADLTGGTTSVQVDISWP
ncbi:hypothetical protein ACFLUV_04720 [Elusimicrobiota bacterium]